MDDSGLFHCIELHDQSLMQQAKFLRNYMRMFEVLLLFNRASREENWKLHLTSLNSMIPYFFSHDQLNYARYTPLYLATMMELQTTDQMTWNYLENNFSINKTGVPFCSIGSDHALEQENKLLKVNGGVVGLTRKPAALHRFCLVSPTRNTLSTQFLESSGIIKPVHKTKHHQLSGSTNKRIALNVKNTTELNFTFEESDCVFNVLSFGKRCYS